MIESLSPDLHNSNFIKIYTEQLLSRAWLQQYQGRKPTFACILGFTDTGLIPGISAAGATPEDRRYTAIADAEFLYKGSQIPKQYPLPPLDAGASPVLITRAVIEASEIPLYIFNAGLPEPPAIPVIDLGGTPARCLTSGQALTPATVKHLFKQGLIWGEKLAANSIDSYLIISECVVGGTTTALALLTALGVAASGKVNSSHPTCNHQQKWAVVKAGLQNAGWQEELASTPYSDDPMQIVAALGDPMQITAAGMAIAASRSCGVLLAGGTQMLAVYALIQALVSGQNSVYLREYDLSWRSEQIVVGTTRWVAEDFTGDTVGLAKSIGMLPNWRTPPLLATGLSFANSRYSQLQAYEQGFVKEGVGAGGCAIAAHLYHGWNQVTLLQVIENLVERC